MSSHQSGQYGMALLWSHAEAATYPRSLPLKQISLAHKDHLLPLWWLSEAKKLHGMRLLITTGSSRVLQTGCGQS